MIKVVCSSLGVVCSICGSRTGGQMFNERGVLHSKPEKSATSTPLTRKIAKNLILEKI